MSPSKSTLRTRSHAGDDGACCEWPGCAGLRSAAGVRVLCPAGWGRRVYAGLLGLASLATAGVAVRHLYIQSLPPGTVAACGASLDFMLKVFPLTDVLVKVLTGSGECAKVEWRFLGLAMPAWVLIAAIAAGAYGLWANIRRRPPMLRF